MGAAAVPIAVGLGSMAAAKMSGASTAGIRAGALGGAGGYFAGPALGLTGGSASGLWGWLARVFRRRPVWERWWRRCLPVRCERATGGGGESGGGSSAAAGLRAIPDRRRRAGKSERVDWRRPAPKKKADRWNVPAAAWGPSRASMEHRATAQAAGRRERSKAAAAANPGTAIPPSAERRLRAGCRAR